MFVFDIYFLHSIPSRNNWPNNLHVSAVVPIQVSAWSTEAGEISPVAASIRRADYLKPENLVDISLINEWNMR